jgi:hypothetical protein
MQKRLPTHAAQAQIEQLWQELAHDPVQQALACAALCQEQAPHLAEWLKAKILAGIPDRELIAITRPPVTDGRIQAYSQLCELTSPAPPQSGRDRPPRSASSAQPPEKPRRAGRDKQALTAFQANYQHIFGVVPETLLDVPPDIRVEPELGRASVVLKLAALYRLYVVARDITRRGNGCGRATKKALKQHLAAYGVYYSREHFSRLLRAGEGLFWNRSCTDLYLYNPARVAALLAQMDPAVFATNKPGVRDMYLSPTGTLEEWEAKLYAGWLAHRNNPTIARETLARLFGRSADTLRLWEEKHLAGVLTVRTNYTQCPHPQLEDGRYVDHIPEHNQAYRGFVRFQGQWHAVTRLYWQTCNTYQISGIRQHPRKGQARKVRKRINAVLDQPASLVRGGLPRLKRYFDTPEGLKRQVRKHGGVYYLWRGENRRGYGIFELNGTGFWMTYPNEFHSTLSHSLKEKV